MRQPGFWSIHSAFYRGYFHRAWWMVIGAALVTPLLVLGLFSLIRGIEVESPGDSIFTLVAIFHVTLIPLLVLSPIIPWSVQFPLPVSTKRLFVAHYGFVMLLSLVCGWISMLLTLRAAGAGAEWPVWRIMLWIAAATSLGCAVNWPLQRSIGLQALVGLAIPSIFLIRLVLLMSHHMEFGQAPVQWFAKFFPEDIILCVVVLVLSGAFAFYGLRRSRIGEDLRRPNWATWIAERRADGEVSTRDQNSALQWLLLQNAGNVIRWGGLVLVIGIFCCHFAMNDRTSNVPGFMAIAPCVVCGFLSVFAGAACGLLDGNHTTVGFPSYHSMLPMTDVQMAKITTKTFLKIVAPSLVATLMCIVWAAIKSGGGEQFPVKFPQPGVPGIAFALLAAVTIMWVIGSVLLSASLARQPEFWFVLVFYGGVIGVVFEDKFGPVFTMVARVMIWGSLLIMITFAGRAFVLAARHQLISPQTLGLTLFAGVVLASLLAGSFYWHEKLSFRAVVFSGAVASLAIVPIAGIPLSVFRNRHR